MIEIDGSRYSGSGTIVRQAVALAALTRQAVRITNVRASRPNPGLRAQHTRVVQAIAEVSGGRVQGNDVGSRELTYSPGGTPCGGRDVWDIGSAGSTVLLALALMPVLAFRKEGTTVELRGGLFQDFAPTFYHFEHAVLPLLRRMGIAARAEMLRPGYVPRGGGALRLHVSPVRGRMHPLVLDSPGEVQRIWGIALASHLAGRQVAERMALAANDLFAARGWRATFETINDSTALQPGAALAAFADRAHDARLGADRSGAPRRSAEEIGQSVARALLEDIDSGATVDRHASDQLIIFAALAEGESRFRVPMITDHILSGAWLVREFLGAEVRLDGNNIRVGGVGFAVG